MELLCAVQHYEWGKIGNDSAVAILRSCADTSYVIDESKPYAEMWMGTHLNGPSVVRSLGTPLSDWISKNPSCLGSKVTEKFGHQLPFLFKVLSVNKALSIQAHPSLDHAKELNLKYPELYKDANHKPEIAIALTKFEALSGFRPVHELKNFFQNVPELCRVIGGDLISEFLTCSEEDIQAHLKICFKALMSAEESLVKSQLSSLILRLESLEPSSQIKYHLDLLKRIHEHFPGDVGCFGIYLFNYITLSPGEAIFLGANEIHAYISGDCMECMACSDNVVRAGLTPKFKDVETLCSMLLYDPLPPSEKLFHSTSEDSNTSVFLPPVPDFAVAKIIVDPGSDYRMIERESASICIVIQGSAQCNDLCMTKGQVVFFSAGQSISLQVPSNSEPLICFQAFCNC